MTNQQIEATVAKLLRLPPTEDSYEEFVAICRSVTIEEFEGVKARVYAILGVTFH
jgi:hypothetical protein